MVWHTSRGWALPPPAVLTLLGATVFTARPVLYNLTSSYETFSVIQYIDTLGSSAVVMLKVCRVDNTRAARTI